jgi:hypothetical protein
MSVQQVETPKKNWYGLKIRKRGGGRGNIGGMEDLCK